MHHENQTSQAGKTLPRNGFTFKKFFVAHDKCAMKVGTDGVLLGAWAPVINSKRILDIGTGSGLIALMLAQRTVFDVHVDGVELDADAANQAIANVANSHWSERVIIIQSDIQQWVTQCKETYQLIVSNPPYFSSGSECATSARATARYTTTLNHQTLLYCAEQLLDKQGVFCVILPFMAAETLLSLACAQGWYLKQRMDISDTVLRPVNRVMLALGRYQTECSHQSMTIRDAEHNYSVAYRQLTRDFYLSC
ncbi:MAG: tRNA1(Val) (adenine(37)-N6)-methyltransferase [Candidatus Erwinia impunctatus]|nr:tRNA1(Val) (adenine(37)-N6)-methyltransferase [Culicoides impunctatus]